MDENPDVLLYIGFLEGTLDASVRKARNLIRQRDALLKACKTLYEKARHVSDDPQWAITEDDLEAARVAIAAVERENKT